MLSRKLIKHQPKRRLITYTAALSVLALTLGLAGGALAVHDLEFQLDGDTSTASGTTPSAAQNLDWDSLFNADGSNTSVIDPNGGAGDFTGGSFTRDFGVKVSNSDRCNLEDTTSTVFCTADGTTFATGSKDTLDITGWQCNKDNNVNSKIDIMNAYAAQYLASNGDRLLYFGLEKNKDNGTNNAGFWFLQGGADCVSAGGSEDWTGTHTSGDLLVVAEYSTGGGVGNITAYRWAGGADGCIDSTPLTANCDGLPIGNGGDCKVAPTGVDDSICATTNSGDLAFNGNITTKWRTSDATLGPGFTVVPPDFFEGAVNLTKVFAASGGAPTCFNTFIADTRSSTSLTATLFDFARGQIGECESDISTTQKWRPNDDATVSVTGAGTWSGTVDFTLYEGSLDCNDQDAGTSVYSESDIAVSNGDPDVSTSNTTFIATATNTYSWLVEFTPSQASADAGVGPASHCESTDITVTN